MHYFLASFLGILRDQVCVEVKGHMETYVNAFCKDPLFPFFLTSLFLSSVLTGELEKEISLSLTFLCLFVCLHILCVTVLLACMSVHHVQAWCPGKSEEGIRSLWNGVTDVCEPPCRCWESKWTLGKKEQAML